MFVTNSAWLLIRKRLIQIQLWSIVFQALPFHYSNEYKVGLHFLTQWRQSKHLLILGPKCLMHFSAELSETLRHWCRSVHWHQCKNVRHFGTKHIVPKCLGPKCLRSEVSVHLRNNRLTVKTAVQNRRDTIYRCAYQEQQITEEDTFNVRLLSLISAACRWLPRFSVFTARQQVTSDSACVASSISAVYWCAKAVEKTAAARCLTRLNVRIRRLRWA